MSRQRSAVRNRLEHLAYLSARGISYRLNPWLLARLGSLIGQLYLAIGRRRRTILHYNLDVAFPLLGGAHRRQLAGRVARHFGRAALDALRLQCQQPEQLLAETTIEARTHLDAAMDQGRGVLLLSAHIGAWEVAALVAGLLIPGGLAIVHRPLDNPLLESELQRLRTRFGNQALGKTNVTREVLRRLHSGGVVGMLIDQRCSEREGIQVPFFGRPSWTHPILARLALRTKAPVVPIWGLPSGPTRYKVLFGEPIWVDRLPEAEQNELSLTTKLLQVTEEIIRAHPHQWLWYHDRWRQIRESGRPPAP